MKRSHIVSTVFLVLVFGSNLIGQASTDEESENDPESKLEFLEIKVEGRINQVVIDSTHGNTYLVVQEQKGTKLKPNSWVQALALGNGENLWVSGEFKTYAGSSVKLSLSKYDSPFLTNSSYAWSLNHSTGIIDWQVQANDCIVHPNRENFLGNNFGNTMSLYDSDSGKLLWKKDLEFSKTRNVIFLNDSSLVALEDGIHYVSLEDAQSWYHKHKGLDLFSPFYPSSGRAGIIAGSGLMFGLLGAVIASAATTGMESTSAVGNKSNHYLFEEDAIYLADKVIMKYDYDSNLLWKTDEQSKKRGVSSLVSLEDGIFMIVDYGYRYNTDGVKVRSGDAVCEFYRRSSGIMERSLVLETEGTDFLKDFVLQNGKITFLGNRSLFSIGLDDLETQNTYEFGSTYSNVGLSKFIDPNDFVKVDNKFVKVVKAHENRVLIANTGSKVVEFDQAFEMVAVHSTNDFFELAQSETKFHLLKNEKGSFLIDDDGNLVVDSMLSPQARIENGYLLDFEGSILRLADLGAINK